MHYLLKLLTTMIPITLICAKEGNVAPPGTEFVVTNTGAFVVTSRSANVIAKAYV
jgi:hypothetical protein